jgi:sarcosine oxidase subunit beta
MRTANVVIVGGGVIGCSIAYHLSQFGISGVVLERKHVASGATGVCPGGIRQQFEQEAECLLARRSMKFFEQANTRLEPENPFFLERSGYLFLAYSKALVSRFEHNVAMQNRLGIPSQLVSPADIAAIAPGIVCDGVVGAAFCAEDGFLEDCDGFTHQLLRCARRKSMQLALDEAVSIRREGHRWAVSTATESWVAEHVVVAAGVDSPVLLAPLGIILPITSERRRLAYTEPRPGNLMHPLVVAFERGFAGKQLLNGVFYIGWLKETPESDDLSFVEEALTAGATLLPQLANLPVRRVVAGYYDLTPDHRPILGNIDGLDGLYLAAGFSGHGFMFAPAVGDMLANLIAGDRVDPLLQEFSWQRFATRTIAEGLQI